MWDLKMSFEMSSADTRVKEESSLSDQKTPEKKCNIPCGKCTCVEKLTCNYCSIQECKIAWTELKKPFITPKGNIIILNKDKLECVKDNKSDTVFQCSDGIQKQDISDSLEDKKGNKDFRYSDIIQNQDISDKDTKRDMYFQCYNIIHNQDISDCVNDKKRDTNCQCNDILKAKCDIAHMDSESNSGFLLKTKDEQTCDTKTNAHTDSPPKEELVVKTDTVIYTNSITENCKRIRRSVKRKRDLDDSCPICGLTIRLSDLKDHFDKEVENLSKIPKNGRKLRLGYKGGVNTTFVQVKCNRENRLSAKVAKYSKKFVNQVYCPVCCIRLSGSDREINDHVENCSLEDDVNITGYDDTFEEYEIGGETRVRAISFVPGGYNALQGHSSRSRTRDNDEDLNIDVDDTLTYGKPQYTELDVIHNLTDSTEDQALEQLRKAVLVDPTAEPNILECRKWSSSTEEENKETKNFDSVNNTKESCIDIKSECIENKDNSRDETQGHIVLSLKEKIKQLEEQNKNQTKCLICLEPYTKPVVSTTCWHVHCEECWLMTMGVKKLCPQCNLIVFPTDLRRIYL